MPNKPRRKKTQRLPQGKRQAIPGQAASTVQPAAPVPAQQTIARPRAMGGAAGATAPARVAAYSYVGKELLTISILAAVMLTVVIVLTLVLR